MICSMTGFGRYEYVDNGIRFNVEIKSVNHRYLELNIKLPKKLNFFEPEIRNYIKKAAPLRSLLIIHILYTLHIHPSSQE